MGAYAYSAAAATAMSNANSRIADPNNTDTVFDYPSIFAEEYRKANPGIGEKLNAARRSVNNLGFTTSTHSASTISLSMIISRALTKRRFSELPSSLMTAQTSLVYTMITEEGAQAILDYGFNEMSLLNSSNFAVENAVVAGLR